MKFLFSFLQEINGLKSLMAECPQDKDMLDMAAEELGQAIEEEKRLQSLLLKSLLPKDDADERDSILEVRAGNKGLYKEGHLSATFVVIYFLVNMFQGFLGTFFLFFL